MESFAPEAFSEVKGSELILCTRAVMIPVSRNYVGGRGGGEANFSQKTKREFCACIFQRSQNPHIQGDIGEGLN